MNFTPAKDRILVRESEHSRRIGSIHLPESSTPRTRYGEVLASSVEELKVGDFVVWRGLAGHSLEELGEGLKTLFADDVMGTVDEIPPEFESPKVPNIVALAEEMLSPDPK